MIDYKKKVLNLYFEGIETKYSDLDEYTLDELLPYEQPTKYIVESEKYNNTYKTPVLTAGKTFILGYTNEKNGIFNASPEKPVIIFDDFTTASKYVDFDFKVKSSAMKILHISDLVNPKYIYYLMQTLDIDVSTHKRYWISTFGTMSVKIPSRKIQDVEVKKIDMIYEYLNQLEKHYNELNLLKKILKEKVLDNAIQGVLVDNNQALQPIDIEEVEEVVPFEIPSNWRWTKMENCFTFKQGVQIDVSLQKIEKTEECPLRFLRIVDFTQNNSDIRYVSSKYENWYINEREVAIVRYGASAGFICLGKSGVLANNLFKLIPKIDIYEKYTYFLLNSGYFQKKIRTHSVAMPALKFASLNKILIPIPPLEEQKKIVEKIESIFELIEQL